MKSITTSILFFVAATAAAAPPSNIANTHWTLQANRSVSSLHITSQGGAGAPGAAICQSISGTLTDVVNVQIRGWYCPSTGRIHFKHNNLATDVTVRVFIGNISDVAAGLPLLMSGTVMVDDAAFGSLGEYNFSATQ